MHVLPALRSIMTVLKTSDKEVIFMIGPKNSHIGVDNHSESTLCQLHSRKGDVVVGLSGSDRHAPPTGFWKRLGCYLRGDKV